MTSRHYDNKQLSAAERYNAEAQQVYLRSLDGREGTWERHGPKANLYDIIYRNNETTGE